MEESDGILIQTLKEHISLPDINSLSEIKADDLFSISIKVLSHLSIDTSEIVNLAAKKQKFRSMAKLNQKLQQVLESSFEMNDLMNPSVSFIRKFILLVVHKLGYTEAPEKSKGSKGIAVSNKDSITQKKILKTWVGQQWIHPSLNHKRHKYRGYVLPITINKNMLKNNIDLTQQLSNPLISGCVQASLNMSEAKLQQRVRQFEANEGFSRKENQQTQIRLQNIVKNNKDDWFIHYNKLHKIKKKILEQKIETQSQIIPEAPSVFKQELEDANTIAEKKKEVKLQQTQTVDETSTEISLSPMEMLQKEAQNKRRNLEIQIRDILTQLQQRKAAIQSWESEKEMIQEKMISDEQRIQKLKQQTIDLKKHVEKRQVILETLEGQKNIEEEVSKLQQEIKMIENQAEQEVKKTEDQIKEIEIDSKRKMEALNDLKAKLNKIQSEYANICEEIAEKEELKGNVKIRQSAISRVYYHKKISEMEKRWREQERQTKKLKIDLNELREKTKISLTLSGRVEIEIDNILNSEKGKKQQENKPLKDLINRCKSTYQNTIKILQEVNQVKTQTQDYEVKVHTLSGKNFKQNIEKIEMALKELKREMSELSKSKTK